MPDPTAQLGQPPIPAVFSGLLVQRSHADKDHVPVIYLVRPAASSDFQT